MAVAIESTRDYTTAAPITTDGAWLKALHAAASAADKHGATCSRPTLAGVLWQGTEMLAADGYRLHRVVAPVATPEPYILAVEDIRHLLRTGRSVTIAPSSPMWLTITVDGHPYSVRRMEGTHPASMWQKIAPHPDKDTYRIEVDRRTWVKALDAMVRDRPKDNILTISPDTGYLWTGAYETEQTVTYAEPRKKPTTYSTAHSAPLPVMDDKAPAGGFKFAVNARYLRDALRSTHGARVTLAGPGPNFPIRIDDSTGDTRAIVMPMLVKR